MYHSTILTAHAQSIFGFDHDKTEFNKIRLGKLQCLPIVHHDCSKL